MEANNEMDKLLKHSLQFDENELPEPDSSHYKSLLKKIKSKKPVSNNKFVNGLIACLNMDIKLYHAGLAIMVVILIFIFLRPSTETNKQYKNNIIIADTNIGVNQKQDTFIIRNSSNGVN
ncbi:MAG TPA: hypothetical protein VNZ45_18885 [Bacteroidia bacterium]|jgi:hypothetical protein|nr:hypothetical protein [Bacteroidia bacterium]